MPSSSEIRQQLERENEHRQKLAVPAFGGGFLYLISALIIYETLNAAPTVGLLQGLAPALSGVANPAVSPRTLAAISFGVLTLILLLLLDATRFRRPETWGPARIVVIVGGVGSAIISIAREVVSAIQSHSFAVGHDHSIQAAENALSSGALNSIVNYVGLLATLALTVGMIATLLNALRVGLVVRWMGILGMFAAVITFAPLLGEEGEIILAFWMVMMGVLYIGKWPNGEPPAWASGEARPWPSQARGAAKGGGAGATPSASGAAAVPAPVVPAGAGSSRKRRRKRGGR
jgi:hypothetical protein